MMFFLSSTCSPSSKLPSTSLNTKAFPLTQGFYKAKGTSAQGRQTESFFTVRLGDSPCASWALTPPSTSLFRDTCPKGPSITLLS